MPRGSVYLTSGTTRPSLWISREPEGFGPRKSYVGRVRSGMEVIEKLTPQSQVTLQLDWSQRRSTQLPPQYGY